MASERIPSSVDWHPYQATAVVLLCAIALNLWTGNGLWLAYCLVGTAVFLFVVGLVRAGHWRPDTRAMWLVGIAVGLHYVGGSLAGLHQVGGPNGLYYAFPWWDNVVHALGMGAVAVVGTAGMLHVLPTRRALSAFLGIAIAALVGTLVELYEFAGFIWFDTVDQGYYTNTLVDLYSNLVGGAMGAVLYVLARPKQRPSPPSSASLDPSPEPRVP